VKTAVLLTGQLRSIEFTKKILADSFRDADFFLSIDKDNSLQCAGENGPESTEELAITRVVDYFKPKGVYVNSGHPNDYRSVESRERTIRVSKHRGSSKELTYEDYLKGNLYQKRVSLFRRFRFRLEDFLQPWVHPKILGVLFQSYLVEVVHRILFEQYFYVHQAFVLLRDYEKARGIQYSTVVRLRFDQLLLNDATEQVLHDKLHYDAEAIAFMDRFEGGMNLDFSTLKDDEIVIFGFGHLHHYFWVNDQHFVVNAVGSKILERFYSELHELISDSIENDMYPTHEARIEYLFALFLSRNRFHLRKSSDFGYRGVFVRTLNAAR